MLQMPTMSSTQWTVLALAALAVFWMVGAYNRLMALRNSIGAAWSQIDAALKLRADVVAPLLAGLRGPLAAELGALDALSAAHAQAQQAAQALGARPVAVATAAEWVRCETQLASASSRLLALMEQQPDAAGSAELVALAATWQAAAGQLAFARRVFDSAAQAYNEAARQRPTRWLLRLFGFGPAGLLGQP
jgi:LemA protein